MRDCFENRKAIKRPTVAYKKRFGIFFLHLFTLKVVLTWQLVSRQRVASLDLTLDLTPAPHWWEQELQVLQLVCLTSTTSVITNISSCNLSQSVRSQHSKWSRSNQPISEYLHLFCSWTRPKVSSVQFELCFYFPSPVWKGCKGISDQNFSYCTSCISFYNDGKQRNSENINSSSGSEWRNYWTSSRKFVRLIPEVCGGSHSDFLIEFHGKVRENKCSLSWILRKYFYVYFGLEAVCAVGAYPGQHDGGLHGWDELRPQGSNWCCGVFTTTENFTGRVWRPWDRQVEEGGGQPMDLSVLFGHGVNTADDLCTVLCSTVQ